MLIKLLIYFYYHSDIARFFIGEKIWSSTRPTSSWNRFLNYFTTKHHQPYKLPAGVFGWVVGFAQTKLKLHICRFCTNDVHICVLNLIYGCALCCWFCRIKSIVTALPEFEEVIPIAEIAKPKPDLIKDAILFEEGEEKTGLTWCFKWCLRTLLEIYLTNATTSNWFSWKMAFV